MFSHTKHLQYHAKPERPDPVYARKLQEVLGGQWGEITVMMQYLFQGWNCRGPAKYKDMLLDIGTEEIAHVEMLATMIARLLEGAPEETQQQAAKSSPVAAVMGGTSVEMALLGDMNPQHAIVTGLGAAATDSVGYPWNSRYTIASGNMLADFRSNLTAESQGRLQVCRLYEMTSDSGVRDMLSFLIARDALHQNQWIQAIAELEADGIDGTPCPKSFPVDQQLNEVANKFMNCSLGDESSAGSWAGGPMPDGTGDFEFDRTPKPMSEEPVLAPAPPMFHSMDPKVAGIR